MRRHGIKSLWTVSYTHLDVYKRQGIFTPTESAAVAVVYGLIVSIFVYKEMTVERIKQIVIDSVKGTANILLLIMAATLFGYCLLYTS